MVVPKELRPPSRHEAFNGGWDHPPGLRGTYKVTGKFRIPRAGEYFWGKCGKVLRADTGRQLRGFGPRVLLRKVSK